MALFLSNPTGCIARWVARESSSPDDILEDIAFISQDLWRVLFDTPDSHTGFVEISMPVSTSFSWVCKGRLDVENAEHVVSVPGSWKHIQPAIFNEPLVRISRLRPPTLTSVIVIAMTRHAYLYASEMSSSLRNFIFSEDRLLDEGDTFTLSGPQEIPLQYQLQLLEPFRRGHAQVGATTLTLLSSSSIPEHSIPTPTSFDLAAVEIDEGFLASSVLYNPSMERHYLGVLPSSSFRLKSLDGEQHLVEDEWSIYVRTRDLGKLGVLSGNWVVISVQPSCTRLVKIVGDDDLARESFEAMASPTLVHNLRNGLLDLPHDLHLSICPVESYNPAIPTARCVTVARVACAFSTSKKFEGSILVGLKRHFHAGKKLVKRNDLFVIRIDTSVERWPQRAENNTRRLGFVSAPGQLVFFRVTNLDYDITVGQSDFEIASGELGCWVDSNVTRIIQSGFDHTPVPNLRLYPRQVGNRSAPLNNKHAMKLVDSKQRFLDLASGIVSKYSADFRVNTTFLMEGGRGIGKFTAVEWVARTLGLHLLEIDCYDLVGESTTKTGATLQVRFGQAREIGPCILVLRHLEALLQTTTGQDKDTSIATSLIEELSITSSYWKATGHPLVVVATTAETDRVPQTLLSCFKHTIKFGAPDEEARLMTLKDLLVGSHLSMDVVLSDIAVQTASLLAQDLRDLIYRTRAASMRKTDLRQHKSTQHDVMVAADFSQALAQARAAYSESIGAPKIPTVTWDDVGGLAHVKADILDTIQLPLEHPDLFADGLKKRSGVLLYGPPGTGKTLVAKAVATSCSLNFFSVKGPELLNMYIGESEANVRRVFQRARDAKPCVIFFDELDSVAPKRGNHGDSGGVMDRIVSQLLAELDGMSSGGSGADVFVIGATNRPDLLDPALLRPGRFDRMLYLGVSQTHEAQLDILEALTRKFQLAAGLSLRSIAEKCPFNYTGADFYALCSDAMLNAMSRTAEAVEQKIGDHFDILYDVLAKHISISSLLERTLRTIE
ncbi:P-loop containing nucleoside triphosphate hydrolase protein [Crepidotus variabilis]|uniref:Peroxisomal ATPase PEX6 n=1 Tax=Crepidotus variabilis TaxID=179855 RepID=A0A9P6JTZ9_9AGAR|nr:P-loop containing nucleoside triphosphate hydrolase protein [Crepidotus variabilis]